METTFRINYEEILPYIKKAVQETLNQVLENLNLDETITTLQSYPAKIKAQQTTLISLQRSLEDAKLELETIKADIIADINAAVGENGKPLFSNEKAREAEFIRRAKSSPEYQEALSNYRAVEDSYNEAKFTLDQLYNEFSAQKAILAALAAKVNFLAGIPKI
ncbi:hypothetical protein [Desulfovirgula thermocuniculi]|uniref:hypothetical protein n=1 Tax=Desulfovirgula thermocuniculi TaxID=348842 RepID=UPI0004230A30|nr:hypothetical protein [Desulfovirgula thermocuniculi]